MSRPSGLPLHTHLYPDLTVGARPCRAFGALGDLVGNVPSVPGFSGGIQACSNSASLLPSESTSGSSSLPKELLTVRRFDSSSPPPSTCSSNHNPMIVDEILYMFLISCSRFGFP